MVEYGKSLKKSRRRGWEPAYLDYHDLKRILNEIEFCIRSTMSSSAAEKEDEETNKHQQHRRTATQPTLPLTTQSGSNGKYTTTTTSMTSHHSRHNTELSPLIMRKNNTIIDRQQPIDVEEGHGGRRGERGGGTNGLADYAQGVGPDSLKNEVVRLKIQFVEKLRSEIEKLSLFTLQRLGDLADTLGTLRFEKDEAVASLFHVEQHILRGYSSPRADDDNIAAVPSSKLDDQLETYLKIGVDLLHIMQFVALNSVGLRKILKKYRKTVQQFVDDPQYYHISGRSLDLEHLQSVANSQSVAAIQSSLQTALVQLYTRDRTELLFPSSSSSSSSNIDSGVSPYRMLLYFRFQTIIQASHMIRQTLKVVNEPFREYLSRQAMILTGSNLGEVEDISSMRSMLSDPDSLLTLDEMSLNEMWKVWVSDYDMLLSTQDDDEYCTQTTNKLMIDPELLKRTSVAMMLIVEEDDGFGKNVAQLVGRNTHSTEREKAWGGADNISMALNLMSILLYTINYYIISPTANHYASILGYDGAFGASLIGASSFAAIFAAFLYSFWYTRSTIKSALIFSTICALIGNILYALAISYKSMGMAIGGRILCGFGSAEVVNRQMISGCVSFKHMTRASAYFVVFGAIGMGIGPLIAAILDFTAGRDLNVDIHLPFSPAGGIIYDHVTSPAFVMALLWTVEMVCLVVLFREPSRINGSGASEAVKTDDDFLSDIDRDFPIKRESIPASSYTPSMAGTMSSCSSSMASTMEFRVEPSSTFLDEIKTTWELVTMNPGLPVTLFLFCFVELADEVIISSCSMVVRRYFSWHGSAAGFLIAALGLCVLPSDFIVETCSHHVSERSILILSLWVIAVGLVGILNYQGMYFDLKGISEYGAFDPNGTVDIEQLVINGEQLGNILTKKREFPYDWEYGVPVYITFLSIVFMGTIILEGVDTSIMAQVTPSALNDRFINR